MTKIEIYTPAKILQLHTQKNNPLEDKEENNFDPLAFQKEFFLADLLFCDDSFAIPSQFLTYLQRLQQKHSIVFVNDEEITAEFMLQDSFTDPSIEFIQGSQYQKLLPHLYDLAQKDPNSTIVLYTKETKKDAIAEDIAGFSGLEAGVLTANNNPQKQILLVSYNLKAPIQSDYTFFTDGCEEDPQTLTILSKSSRKRSFIIYKEECATIATLKKELKDSNESH
jgi:hypothetical protein